jgi:hypothetical protein
MKLPTLSEQTKWMLKGAGFTLALVLVGALVAGGWIVYVRSLHGQMAYEYILQVQQAQQQQQQKAMTPPAKP